MRFTKTQAYQHQARLHQEGEEDLMDKFRVIYILRDEFGLHGLTGEVLTIDEDCYRFPDIFIKKSSPEIVIELDGEIHGDGDEVSKREKDVWRDKDYLRIGVKLIIINKSLTNGYEKAKVIDCLCQAGLARK